MTTEMIRDVLSTEPKLKAANERLARAQADLTAVEGEIGAVLLSIGEASERVRNTVRDETTLAARNYLEGRSGALTEDVIQTIQAHYEDLVKRRRILRRAVELAKEDVLGEQMKASREICDELKPTHHALVRDLGLALIAAGVAEARLEAFYTGLEAAHVQAWNSNGDGHIGIPMHFRPISNPAQELGSGRLPHWLSQAVEWSYIDASEIPTDWLARWGTPAPWERSKPRLSRLVERATARLRGLVRVADGDVDDGHARPEGRRG